MSLKEAYTLAHSAQCRLQLAASRPDRNLRFVVGHLMHYENLRLRIVQIEHDISRSERASAVAFQGTGHVNGAGGLRHKPSTGQLGRRSPPPAAVEYDEDEDEDLPEHGEVVDDGDDDEGGLGLTRFPSGSTRPQQHPPPALEPDDGLDEDGDEDDEAVSPEEPNQATLEAAMKGAGEERWGKAYEGVRKCGCHGQSGAPSLGRMWELPASGTGASGEGKGGVTWAVAEVKVEA
ncbi:hypothetical protein LTR35_000424 [Friedmanniomyces endolithicus]|uniref:Uncharacterized protein n=1 Tax=Friedmanniomyces endolithicus TaxID=329885 RepID=A0AAN6FVM8_9PEZI|nr:hypothetical protein LTS00_009266 [Friedmanniomyces endolithicus]KAK0293817.1 hypothetical protein LTR35_000424 [Friedmanniomyces endolithicus]KAK0324332.1 hypothetical protein LTR82_004771 [Friedmanniomyces endolithicus]KAK0972528.1 hypothetical protein LTR54_017560 [Friedmanniomyces endolithicus]